jgi:hypothetical protein
MSKKGQKGKDARGGMPPFKPTAQQRAFVASMAGFRMTWDEIAAVIIDERRNKPISRITLARHFKDELAQGKPRLKTLIQTRYLERLNAGDWQAISFGMRHIAGYFEAINPSLASYALVEGEKDTPTINVSFVLPSKKPEQPPLDLQPSAPIDHTQPRLPPPPERQQTPFGIVERPSKDGWMK